MKKIASILSLALLAGVAALVSAEDTTQPASQPSSEPATTQSAAAENGAVNQYCAIEKDNKIDPKGKTYTYNGKVVGFCCPDCIDEFKKNPEKYMATLK
jgi:YHS domain-containing protein